ncbi:DUF4097 family beta strand repeat-containing protein [Peribacillus sp. SCS-26]|uniref:DUF4097 family beta strand repeat-containing protein n=1 Tax=Paraperibacillus marinus TaxID=3115295 RepID=UPI003905946A
MKEEKKRILEMVEQGKLSAAEALNLLELLEKEGKEEKKLQLSSSLEKGSAGSGMNPGSQAKPDSLNYKVMAAKDKLIDFVDMALTKIKDSDLDFNFGSSLDVSYIFQQQDAAFSSILVDVANGQVDLIPWSSAEVRVECKAKVYRAKEQSEAVGLFMKETNFTVENEEFQFTNSQKWMKINAKIYVPDMIYEKIKIRLFNGSFYGEKLQVNELKAKTANGKLTLIRLDGRDAELETANGQIHLEEAHLRNIEAETINGSIDITGSCEKAGLHSFSGEISCRITNEDCKRVHAKTTASSIHIYLPEGAPIDGDLKTNLGSFHVNLGGIDVVEEKSEVGKKILRFKAHELSERKMFVLAESMSGSLSISRGRE